LLATDLLVDYGLVARQIVCVLAQNFHGLNGDRYRLAEAEKCWQCDEKVVQFKLSPPGLETQFDREPSDEDAHDYGE
jgi:hypothetical protein